MLVLTLERTAQFTSLHSQKDLGVVAVTYGVGTQLEWSDLGFRHVFAFAQGRVPPTFVLHLPVPKKINNEPRHLQTTTQ